MLHCIALCYLMHGCMSVYVLHATIDHLPEKYPTLKDRATLILDLAKATLQLAFLNQFAHLSKIDVMDRVLKISGKRFSQYSNTHDDNLISVAKQIPWTDHFLPRRLHSCSSSRANDSKTSLNVSSVISAAIWEVTWSHHVVTISLLFKEIPCVANHDLPPVETNSVWNKICFSWPHASVNVYINFLSQAIEFQAFWVEKMASGSD